jgi:transcriptional regulator of heat shock response
MAKKTQSELSDYKKIEREFRKELNDTELQQRFDQFEKNVKDFKGLYNILVPQINEQIKNVSVLQGMIVDSARMGFLNQDAVHQLKEVEAALKEKREAANTYVEKFTEEEALIKKYAVGANDKLFHYWKMFKALDPNIAPWLEWRQTYDKKIF